MLSHLSLELKGMMDLKIIAEFGFPWSEKTYSYAQEEVREYFSSAKDLLVDGWYCGSGISFGNEDFLSNRIDDDPLIKSRNSALPGVRDEFFKAMTEYFKELEYEGATRFYIVSAPGLFGSILVGVWCRFKEIYEYMLLKKENYFSIIDIVEGLRYSYRTNEHYYALYKKHTMPPGMDLHKHFFKVYDFITDTILVHVHDEPEVGPIVVENLFLFLIRSPISGTRLKSNRVQP